MFLSLAICDNGVFRNHQMLNLHKNDVEKCSQMPQNILICSKMAVYVLFSSENESVNPACSKSVLHILSLTSFEKLLTIQV